ncbi:glycosyltransferase [Roseivirga sp. BDSF3-8]|uniref:glycosyltransferase n=1 Tax=Roseivirga sp. BDSF3-8 TaxID=3241598 RepID=UPI0035323F8D
MKTDLSIALITPFPPSKTTLNEYGYHLANHFAAKEEITRLYLLTEEGYDIKQAPDDKVEIHPCWSFNSYRNLLSIFRKIGELRPDMVVLNLQFLLFGDKKVAAGLGLLLPLLLRITGFRTIVLLHNIMEEVDLTEAGITQSKLKKNLFTLAGNLLTRCILQADLVGVTIESYVDTLRNKYRAANVALLPHGSFELPEKPEPVSPGGPMKVMTFGKFGTYKKVEVLIEAIELVRQDTGLDVALVIAGTDNPNVGGYLDGVKAKYAHVPAITFTGYVPEEQVPVIFKESTLVVFPYTSTTGSSGVLHQAGSYGKAAVLPDLGDLGRLVKEEGYGGAFFQPGDRRSLANAIIELLTDQTLRRRIERQNFTAATSLYLGDIADWYLIHMERLLAA